MVHINTEQFKRHLKTFQFKSPIIDTLEPF